MSNVENPRAVVGDNRAPDYAQRVTDEMHQQYRETEIRVDALASRADQLPDLVDDASMGPWAKLIKDMRDEAKRIDGLREAEKQPHFRAAQAVDSVFFPLIEKLVRRTKTSKAGIADVLQRDLDAYNQRKLAAEQERRRQEQIRAAEIERQQREAEEKARRAADEARLAADRARKAENIAARNEIAIIAEAEAARLLSESEQAQFRAEEARIATLVRPADMVRTRVDEGPVVTMATEPYAVIENDKLLDAIALWPFVTTAAKEQALRGWARATNYSQPMAGARVGKRPKTVLR